MPLLNIQNLNLSIHGTEILKNVNLSVEPGQIVAIVGESGSGKSLASSAVMRLLPEDAVTEGAIWVDDRDIMTLSERDMCDVRASDLGMVFQEPMTALNPLESIGAQVMEAIKIIGPELSRAQLKERAEIALYRVGLPAERFPLSTYPHKLSGGQRQRVVIAIATSQKPKLLIADEPTTALDVTTQEKILELLKKLTSQDNMGLLLISHDLAVVADVADHIIIMKDGSIVEQGDGIEFLKSLEHPYSKALFAAAMQGREDRFIADYKKPVLEVKGLNKEYKLSRKETLKAVKDVSFTVGSGENVGLVGESGCGKSTLSRCILGVEDYESGEILIGGAAFTGDKKSRRKISVVFQDPYGSFNPRHTVERLISEPFYLLDNPPRPDQAREKVIEMLGAVGLKENDIDKYPHEFSGGQRQRIAIARALITEPDIILLDEATSALDVLIRDQILALLKKLSDEFNISYLFISHDLNTVRNITDRILVMKDGMIVEEGVTSDIFDDPQHPYTKTLLEASPDIRKVINNKKTQEIPNEDIF